MYDYNFLDDSEIEEYYSESDHPCYGCAFLLDDVCISDGVCAFIEKFDNKN